MALATLRGCVAGDGGTELFGEYRTGSSDVSCSQQLVPATTLSQEGRWEWPNQHSLHMGHRAQLWVGPHGESSKIIIVLGGHFEVPNCSHNNAVFFIGLSHCLPQLKLFSESPPEPDEIPVFTVIAALDCFVPQWGRLDKDECRARAEGSGIHEVVSGIR